MVAHVGDRTLLRAVQPVWKYSFGVARAGAQWLAEGAPDRVRRGFRESPVETRAAERLTAVRAGRNPWRAYVWEEWCARQGEAGFSGVSGGDSRR